MKTIIDGHNDIIIKYEAYGTKRNERGMTIWVDEEKKLTTVKNRINGITIYSHITINEFGQTQISQVSISENEIERLYLKIQELKNTEYIGSIPDDDLPF